MKIICCKCKKEYSLEDNIHKYDKANRPILICPHCRFKHIINFMPFEGKIKTEKLKKLNLGGYYPVTIGATRYADANRVDCSGIDNGDAKGEKDWAYDSKSVDIDLQHGSPYGVSMSPDGTRMLTVGTAADRVKQWNLSTPYDVSTAVYASKYIDISPKGGMPVGVRWGDSGYKVYVLEVQVGRVHQYNCPTAYDLGSATYGTYFITGVEDAAPRGITLSYDGSKLYILGSVNDYIYQYTLSTPWLISSASYDSKSLYVKNEDNDNYGIHISDDGYRMWTAGGEHDKIYKYVLGTAHDISTGVFESSYLITEDSYPRDISISADESKMYVMGNGNHYVYQYKVALSGDWDRDNDFILATRIWGSKGPHVQAFKLRWRKLLGTWADVGSSGAITYNATTILVDGNAVVIGERLCDEQTDYTWQDGEESEGDNILPDTGTYSLADEYYTELQWALDCSNAEGGATYEFELWDTTEGTSLGTCVAQLNIKAERDATGKASITSSLTANVQVTSGGPKNRTGKASLTSSIIAVLSRGKIEGATAKASITSSMVALLKKEPKDATGLASLTTTLTAVLSRGKIENATAKADLTTNIDAILSRGKIENATGKASITTLMQAILSNYINATAKASIDTNIDITLARGKIENATGLASIISSMISVLSRGKIEAVTGKASITSNFESILSRGKIENVTGKADITSSIITILSRGKIENTTGKAEIETSVIIILSSGGIKNATGKAEITTNVDSQIRIIRKATAKSSMTSLIDIALSRGKIENATGKANINSSIIIALSRGRIESVTGKASITSGITAALSRGRIESVTGKAEINTIMDIVLNRGKIEDTSGKASIISSLTAILQKEAALNATGKASITTNVEAGIKRIIARAGKASLETSYNAIISRGKIENVNGKAFIYTSMNAKLSSCKRATGKASINSFINVSLKRLINTSGKSIFDTLMEIEITREYAFSQAELSIKRTETEINIKRTETKLGIER